MSGSRPDTWMPLYVGDYLRDTGRLTTEGHGAYLLLIMDYWTSGGPLPDDDDQLAAIAKLPPQRWSKLRPLISRFFQIGDGLWRHKRVDEELDAAAARSESKRVAGSKGAAKRWQSQSQTHGTANSKQDGTAMAELPLRQWQNDAQSQSQSQEASSLRSEEHAQGGSPPPKPRPSLADLKAADFRQYAAEKAPCVKVETELERYRNWLKSKGKVYKDAAAGFRNWLLKAEEMARERGERPPAQANGAKPKSDAASYNEDDWRLVMRSFENVHKSPNCGVWYAAWGAQPLKGRFAEGCLVPKRIQREFGYGAPDGGNSDVSTRAQGEKP